MGGIFSRFIQRLLANISHHHSPSVASKEDGQISDSTEIEDTETVSQSLISNENDEERMSKIANTNQYTAPKLHKPSKPSLSKTKKDSVLVSWKYGTRDGITFRLEMKDVAAKKRWAVIEDDIEEECFTVTGLKASTRYIFRVTALTTEDEGVTSDCTDEVETLPTEVTQLLSNAKQISSISSQPYLYKLILQEDVAARDETNMIRTLVFGTPSKNQMERTIIVVGPCGAGKSTTINNMINYITGVSWEDDVRFIIVDQEKEEAERESNQAKALTDWITKYKIYPKRGFRIDFCLTIIDTPGFGDPRGLIRDKEIQEQIRQLFCSEKDYAVTLLDSICFIVKGSENRLNPMLRYVFECMFSIFGEDVKPNITTFCTFADNDKPNAKDAMDESGLAFGELKIINNASLFAQKVARSTFSDFNLHFWKHGSECFKSFFENLRTVTAISARLTKEVLEERQKIELTLDNMQRFVDEGLTTLNLLKKEKRNLQKYKDQIKDNKDFEYEVDVKEHRQQDLPKGLNVTNCKYCHVTCHYNCGIPNDEDKSRCIAMDKRGFCTECEEKCFWKKHVNTPYYFTFEVVKKKETLHDKLKRYNIATNQAESVSELLKKIQKDYDAVDTKVQKSLEIIRDCSNKLQQIALKKGTFSLVEILELMIDSEEKSKTDGYMDRIKSLKKYKQRAMSIEMAKKMVADAQSITP